MAPGVLEQRQASRAMIAVLLIVAGIFLLSRLHGGQPMDEDFAGYIQQASNIVHGRPLSAMGVIASNGAPAAGHAAFIYPPVYPLLVAPAVGVLGINFTAIKFLQVALLLAALGLVLSFHRQLGFTLWEASATLGVFCLLPEALSQINAVGPDVALLLFLVLALLALEALLSAPPERRIRAAAGLGLAVLLAFDCRAVAIAMLPAAALACVARNGRQTHWTSLLIPGLTFGLLWVLQSALLPPTAFTLVAKGPFLDVIGNLKAFYWHIVDPWVNTRWVHSVTLLLLACCGLAAIGVLDGLRRAQAVSWFVAVYFAMLLILPDFDAGIRYLLPILLFLGALAVRGCKVTAKFMKLDGMWGQGAAAALIVLLMLAMSSGHRTDVEAQAYGVFAPSQQDAFGFLRSHTGPGALIAARKPMAFHLFTQRPVIRIPTAAHSLEDLRAWAAANKVDYLVLKQSALRGDNDYTDCPQSPFCGQIDPRPVFRNADYQVFRLRRE